jgi:hypothetical protein
MKRAIGFVAAFAYIAGAGVVSFTGHGEQALFLTLPWSMIPPAVWLLTGLETGWFMRLHTTPMIWAAINVWSVYLWARGSRHDPPLGLRTG